MKWKMDWAFVIGGAELIAWNGEQATEGFGKIKHYLILVKGLVRISK